MVTFYTKEDYAKAYTELLEILKYIPNTSFEKIPNEVIEMYELNKDSTYIFHYDMNVSFELQNVMQLTRILIANLYIDYWATDKQRELIQKHDNEEFEQLELEKRKLYDPDNIFSNRKNAISKNVSHEQQTSLAIVKDYNIFTKLIKKIRKMLHIDKSWSVLICNIFSLY